MSDCRVCGGSEFFKEAGYYFCTECQTQNEDKREEILELRFEGTRVTKRKIPKSNSERVDHSVQWTTWEQYNFILIRLTDELIELGVTPDIKLTVLQLWAFYLGKTEVAFTSTERKTIPKLARSFHQKDADIIYGKLKARKRKRRTAASNSSVVSSQFSETSSVRELNKRKRLMVRAEYNRLTAKQTSESDATSFVSQSLRSVRSFDSQSSAREEKLKYSKHANEERNRVKVLSKKLPRSQRLRYQQNHVTTKYRTGPNVITPMKLWAILYLALRIHKQDIHLADMLRYGREGHLSYYRLDHLLPAEMAPSDHDVKLLTQNNEITHKGMRRTCADMAKFLFVYEITCPDITQLISRYCTELCLPNRISTYAARLIALAPPKMIFNKLEPLIPNYEGRAMAFIIVVLKVLLGMDGITEYETSRIAEIVNSNMLTSKLHKYDHICKSTMQRITKSTCKPNTATLDRLSNVCIIVHGGCGQCSDSILCEKLDGCKKAASLGYKKIMNGGNSLDAVEAALWWLESDESFNCGYGSVLNQLGEVQMDASIMDGDRLEIGSVAAVSDVEHPIKLARFILENYPNTIAVGEGAKNLSRCTNTNWISKGNMVSPRAIQALNLSANCNNPCENFEHADSLKKSWGTTGCVVWDGRSIAAGTTTGGLSGKMVGRIGDSPLLGCGTFANNFAGCSLSGHGEMIMKLGLSRNIVTEIGEGLCPENALKLNIDSMFSKSNRESGGIVLKRNGCWGVYFTTPRMPYAVVKKNVVTFGANPSEKQTENKIDDPHTKLFSFREWQRFIECRRNLLISKHYPTQFKNDSDGFGNVELYVNFIKSALSRREEKPEIRNYKNIIPRNLANAMEKCANMLVESSSNSDSIEIFPPSLTPQYSYLEQLLENPMHDFPGILRHNFSNAKISYLTKPKKFMKSAAECGVKVEIVRSRLHFVDKLVPQFEKSKMPSLGEWNTVVTISEIGGKGVPSSSACLNKKDSQLFKLSATKQSHYDAVQEKLKTNHGTSNPEDSEFGFEDAACDGKLAIPSSRSTDSDNESVVDPNAENKGRNKTESLTFDKKYNLQLPDYCTSDENQSPRALPKIRKVQELTRGVNGKFIRKNSTKKGEVRIISRPLQTEAPCPKKAKNGCVVPSKKITALMKNDESLVSETSEVSEKIFISCEDYWMYHCIFSRVKPKNFEHFESELPVSFQWLLNECADIVEMSTEDLYEQVCFVETHFAYILKPDNLEQYSYDPRDNRAKIRLCKKKW